MKLLITAGATQETIDGVRYITNFSTGGTAAELADYFSKSGFSIHYLHGKSALRPRTQAKMDCLSFGCFDDLNSKIRELLSRQVFDAIIHLAAVSDYSVEAIELNGRVYQVSELLKVDSRQKLAIRMRSNFKIIDKLKSYAAANDPLVIGFKLTNSTDRTMRERQIFKLSKKPQVDIVVHNDMHDINIGERQFVVYQREKSIAHCGSRSELAVLLNNLIRQRLTKKEGK